MHPHGHHAYKVDILVVLVFCSWYRSYPWNQEIICLFHSFVDKWNSSSFILGLSRACIPSFNSEHNWEGVICDQLKKKDHINDNLETWNDNLLDLKLLCRGDKFPYDATVYFLWTRKCLKQSHVLYEWESFGFVNF